MKVTVAIPIVSFERLPMLARAIESLRAQSHKNIHIVVVVDGKPELYKLIKSQFPTSPDLSIILNKEHSYWVASVNRVLKEFDSDFYVYGADDIVFPLHCIASAVAIMKEQFPDGLGLVNIFRRNKATFGLFGRKWAEMYPDRQALCPDFIQYGADREIGDVARELGVYAPHIGTKNNVRHHLKTHDETWMLAERTVIIDPETRRKRKKKGYKWGINFDLVRK